MEVNGSKVNEASTSNDKIVIIVANVLGMCVGKREKSALTQLEMLHHVNVAQQMFAMHL